MQMLHRLLINTPGAVTMNPWRRRRSTRILLSLLFTLALLLTSLSTNSFAISDEITIWPNHITARKTVTQPGLTAGDRETTVELRLHEINHDIPSGTFEFFDYVPERFTLDESSFIALINDEVIDAPIITYDPSTRVIYWKVPEPSPDVPDFTDCAHLIYTMTAKDTWYGALYTNREEYQQFLFSDGDEDLEMPAISLGAYYVATAQDQSPQLVRFDNPHILVRPYAKEDTYDMDMNTELHVDSDDDDTLLQNDLQPDVNQLQNDLWHRWHFSNLLVDTESITEPLFSTDPVYGLDPGSGTLDVQEDGSFSFIPAEGFHGEVTFWYRSYVNAWETILVSKLNAAPKLAIPGDMLIDLPDIVEPEGVMLASDLVKVTITVHPPKYEGTQLFVQKYIGESSTVPGQGFSFVVIPNEEELAETNTRYEFGPTDVGGRASVVLPDGQHRLYETGPSGYINDLPENGFSFMTYSGMAAYSNEEPIPNNTIVVHNIPVTTPTPDPEPTTAPTPEPTHVPTPVPTSAPTSIPTPIPSNNVPLIVEVVGPGTAVPGSGAYSLDSMVYMTITPNDGATFTGWTGPDGGAVDGDNRITMSTSRYIIANFAVPAEVTPATTPVPEPLIVIPAPNVPEATPDVAEEIVTEVTVPQAAPVLPKTAGIPLAMLISFGFVAIGTGWKMKK